MRDDFSIINILDMLDTIGEDTLKEILSNFSCPKNKEIEYFVRNTALGFAKSKISVTHLVMDENGELAAIFTITHKPVEIVNNGLSGEMRKKLGRYAQLNEETNSYLVSAFLIAQFGKNAVSRTGRPLSGDELMDNTLQVLKLIQRDVGGGIVFLECEDTPKLLGFYTSEHNKFRKFGTRMSEVDNTQYIQLLRFF